jgi:hypothetical protein
VEEPVHIIEGEGGEEDDDDDAEYDDDDDDDDEYEKTRIETIAEQFEAKGYTMVDALSMLTGIYSKNEKYTNEYNLKMESDFDEIVEDAKNEAYEETLFAEEDINILTL